MTTSLNQTSTYIKLSMFIRSKRWFVNIEFHHRKRQKQYDKNEDNLKEATGEGVEEKDHAECLNELQIV